MKVWLNFEGKNLFKSKIYLSYLLIGTLLIVGFFSFQKLQESNNVLTLTFQVQDENQRIFQEQMTVRTQISDLQEEGQPVPQELSTYLAFLAETTNFNRLQVEAIKNSNQPEFLENRMRWLENNEGLLEMASSLFLGINPVKIALEKERVNQIISENLFYELEESSMNPINYLVILGNFFFHPLTISLLIILFALPLLLDMEQGTFRFIYSETNQPSKWLRSKKLTSIGGFLFFTIGVFGISSLLIFIFGKPLIGNAGRNNGMYPYPLSNSLVTIQNYGWTKVLFGIFVFILFSVLLSVLISLLRKSFSNIILFTIFQAIGFMSTQQVSFLKKWWNPYFLLDTSAYLQRYESGMTQVYSVLVILFFVGILEIISRQIDD